MASRIAPSLSLNKGYFLSVTIRDVANRLGLSITTVSRALAGYDDVSQPTRKLILKTVEQMGYFPNAFAQRLRKQCTDTIGFVIPTYGNRFADPFFVELLSGISNEAALNKLDLLVLTCAPDHDGLEVYKRMVQERRVDGMLVVRTLKADARILYLLDQDFPFVAFGRTRSEIDFCYLDVDGTLAIYEVVRHLIKLGRRRIAIILPPNNLMFTYYRQLGFRKGLMEADLPFEQRHVIYGDLTEQSGYDATLALLNLDKPPDAIVTCNDLMAVGAINAAQELGLTVGVDVGITGFDDIPLADHINPPLTTVRQPIYEIGQRICRMLIRLLHGEALEERHVILKPTLVVRESCGAAIQKGIRKGGSGRLIEINK